MRPIVTIRLAFLFPLDFSHSNQRAMCSGAESLINTGSSQPIFLFFFKKKPPPFVMIESLIRFRPHRPVIWFPNRARTVFRRWRHLPKSAGRHFLIRMARDRSLGCAMRPHRCSSQHGSTVPHRLGIPLICFLFRCSELRWSPRVVGLFLWW